MCEDIVFGGNNVIRESMEARDRIILPPLRVVMNLMRQISKGCEER